MANSLEDIIREHEAKQLIGKYMEGGEIKAPPIPTPEISAWDQMMAEREALFGARPRTEPNDFYRTDELPQIKRLSPPRTPIGVWPEMVETINRKKENIKNKSTEIEDWLDGLDKHYNGKDSSNYLELDQAVEQIMDSYWDDINKDSQEVLELEQLLKEKEKDALFNMDQYEPNEVPGDFRSPPKIQFKLTGKKRK